MLEIRETETFSKWFNGLRDIQARARIVLRVRRLSLGNFGDVARLEKAFRNSGFITAQVIGSM